MNITNKECDDEIIIFKLILDFYFKAKIPLKHVKPSPLPAKSYVVIATLHNRRVRWNNSHMRFWNVFVSPTIFISPQLNVAVTQASYINAI